MGIIPIGIKEQYNTLKGINCHKVVKNHHISAVKSTYLGNQFAKYVYKLGIGCIFKTENYEI